VSTRSQLRRGAGWLRHAVRRAVWAVEDRRLIAEQRRLELGPAHRRWRSNSVGANREWWDRYDWTRGGDEWTESAEWKQALIDEVMLAAIPSRGEVLEIGPGAGRWSLALAENSLRLVVVDISAETLRGAGKRLAAFDNVTYVHGGGSDLPGIADGSIDAVWSFDVFVHIAPPDFVAYLDEIARVLRPGGVAVIHHSDGRNRGRLLSRHGWRAPMSRELFAALAQPRGLALTRQIDSWGEDGQFDLAAFADVISVCRRG
jgi:ubiquinone/menaquinone biosynthesis C-methylase UbiE